MADASLYSWALIALLAVGCVPSGPVESDNRDVVVDSLAWHNARILESPGDANRYAARAEFHLRRGETGQAVEDYALALQVDSNRLEDRQTLGDLRFDVRDFEGAVREWEAALRVDPDYPPALLSLARVDLLLRSYESALQRMNQALRVDDRLDEAYFLKGRLYLETRDTVKAVSSFQTAAEVNPQRYDAFIQLGLLYAGAGNDLALEYFRTARSLRPNSIEALYDEAIYLQESGLTNPERYAQALGLYDRILELDSMNASAAFNKGFVYLEYRAQYDSAEHWFDEAIARLPYYHQAHYNRGLAIESQGRTEEALEAYDAALTLDPTYTPAAIAKGRILDR